MGIALPKENGHNYPNQITPNVPITLHDAPLPPGETIEVPIVLTADQTGMVDVLGLVMYENAEADAVGATKLWHSVQVEPLLALASSSRPARTGANGYLVAVEVSLSAECGRY
jgi:hypothetical protein